MKKIKRFIKIFFIKYFDFYYYKNEKYLDFLKYLFTYNKKLKFNNTVVKIPIKSFFTYIFFNRVFDNYEKNNIKLFEFLVKKFNVFIDVGANFGLYSMLFSSKKNKSLSIELNPTAFDQLNIVTKNNQNIKTYNIGISDKNSSINFPKYHPIRMSTSLESSVYSDLGTKKISIFSIDQFVKENLLEKNIDVSNLLIKIDIEGAEAKLFKNSDNLIKNIKPFICLELHPQFIPNYGSTVYNILEYLNNNLYEFYELNEFLEEINYKNYNKYYDKNSNRWFLFCSPVSKKNQLLEIKKDYKAS